MAATDGHPLAAATAVLASSFCRYTPLKAHWMEIYTPIVEHMKIQIRMNPAKRCVELKVSQRAFQPSHVLPLLCAASPMRLLTIGSLAALLLLLLILADLPRDHSRERVAEVV